MSETAPEPQAPPAAPPTPAGSVRHKVPRVMEAIRTEAWAITEDMMATICSIASRENEVSIEALEAMQAKRVAGTFDLRVRDGVAIMSVQGPIMKHADVFAMISGATSYEAIRRDLETAMRDPSVRAVLISFDSPGGMVNGCAECADAIREASAIKPVEAYVGGQACSAAYWLATACSRITIARTGDVGSIGTVMSVRDTSERDARSGIKTTEFVSSRAPNKRVAYDSDEGKAKVMRYIDTLEGIFIDAVAMHRGVTAEHVAVNFGGGGVEVGADAVRIGMADALGSFEDVFARLKAGNGQKATNKGIQIMSNAPAGSFTQADIDAAVARGRQEAAATAASERDAAAATAATAAQDRIKAIMSSDEAKTRPALANHLAFNTSMSKEDAIGTLKASGEEKAAAAAGGGRAQDAAGGLALDTLASQETPEQKSARIAAEEAKKPKPAAIDMDSIYGARAEAMKSK